MDEHRYPSDTFYGTLTLDIVQIRILTRRESLASGGAGRYRRRRRYSKDLYLIYLNQPHTSRTRRPRPDRRTRRRRERAGKEIFGKSDRVLIKELAHAKTTEHPVHLNRRRGRPHRFQRGYATPHRDSPRNATRDSSDSRTSLTAELVPNPARSRESARLRRRRSLRPTHPSSPAAGED